MSSIKMRIDKLFFPTFRLGREYALLFASRGAKVIVSIYNQSIVIKFGWKNVKDEFAFLNLPFKLSVVVA